MHRAHHPRATRRVAKVKPQPTQLAEEFLAMLAHERAASPHTLRAYQREIDNFAAYLIEQSGPGVEMHTVDHLQIRGYLGELYGRGLAKASVARSLAAVRSWFQWMARAGHVTSNPAALGGDTQAAQASAASALDRADEPPGGNGLGGDGCGVAGARSYDLRTALWMRHPQRRAGGAQCGRRPLGEGSDPGPGQRAEAAVCSAGRCGGRCDPGLSSVAGG